MIIGTASLTLPNGFVTEYSYDVASRLTALTYKKSGVVLGNLTYAYDASGTRTRVGGSFARTALPLAVSTTSYNAANQQTAFGSQTLTFDLNGNLTSDGANTYVWNARDQLVSIAGSVTAGFQYDALGRRRSKQISGSTTTFLYDGENVVQEQSSSTANMLTGGLDEFFTRTDASGTPSPIVDVLGSTVALTDSAGTVQTQYTYEPFGNVSVSGTASSNTSQYTGRENDTTGLYFYRARYYSPSLGRFIGEDPIGVGGGLNLYRYVDNDPINFRDPLGLEKSAGGMASPTATSNGTAYYDSGPQTGMGGNRTFTPTPPTPAPTNRDGGFGSAVLILGCAAIASDGPSPLMDLIFLGIIGTGALAASKNPPKTIPTPSPPIYETDDCHKVRQECLEECWSDDSKVTKQKGPGTFSALRKCMRECMNRKGCFDF